MLIAAAVGLLVAAYLAVAVLLVGYAGAPASATGEASNVSGSAAAASSTGATGSGQFGPAVQLTALATHLRDSGAVFYGAYWCSHCQAQKQMFGAAATRLPYLECDARGTNARPAACDAAGVRAYPTWIINGQKIEGEV